MSVSLEQIGILLRDFGLPTLLLFFIAWGTLRIANYLARSLDALTDRVITPLVTRSVTFVDRLDETLKEHSRLLASVAATLEAIKDEQKLQSTRLDQVAHGRKTQP